MSNQKVLPQHSLPVLRCLLPLLPLLFMLYLSELVPSQAGTTPHIIMDSAPPQTSNEGDASAPQSTGQLPPEAIAFATRMFDAARNGTVEVFEQALPRGLPANLTNDKGDSLVMLAAYHGHASLVELLIRHGADVNRLNDRGQSPLAGVVFKNEKECVEKLLQGGADPEIGTPSALEATKVCSISRSFHVVLGMHSFVEAAIGRQESGWKECRALMA
jgi:ankyrin repeat protein